MEDEKKGEKYSNEIQILCRGKIVYVPYEVVIQYDFLKSYMERWQKEGKPLELNFCSPEKLQEEFDSKLPKTFINDFLGFSSETKEEKEDEEGKKLLLKDLFVEKDGILVLDKSKLENSIFVDSQTKLVKINNVFYNFVLEYGYIGVKDSDNPPKEILTFRCPSDGRLTKKHLTDCLTFNTDKLLQFYKSE